MIRLKSAKAEVELEVVEPRDARADVFVFEDVGQVLIMFFEQVGVVTTADYGPDAYELAKGKPITLLSGNELLYLLQKHGHKARIDLAEARLLTAEREKSEGKG